MPSADQGALNDEDTERQTIRKPVILPGRLRKTKTNAIWHERRNSTRECQGN